MIKNSLTESVALPRVSEGAGPDRPAPGSFLWRMGVYRKAIEHANAAEDWLLANDPNKSCIGWVCAMSAVIERRAHTVFAARDAGVLLCLGVAVLS